jgi:hypothetical protein
MYLVKMYIGRILIASLRVDLRDAPTVEEREKRLRLAAAAMYWENFRRIDF